MMNRRRGQQHGEEQRRRIAASSCWQDESRRLYRRHGKYYVVGVKNNSIAMQQAHKSLPLLSSRSAVFIETVSLP